MATELLTSIYAGAASIAKPLSLSALIASFFFLIARQALSSLQEPLRKALPGQAVDIVHAVLRYFFILSVIALVGGLGSYVVEFALRDYVTKQKIVADARTAINGSNPDVILYNANLLIEKYPSDPLGYSFAGIGHFYANQFDQAVVDFTSALNRVPNGTDVCDASKRGILGNLGAAQGAKEDYVKAVSTLESTLKCRPRDKIDLFNFSKNALAIGDLEKAKSSLFDDALLSASTRPDLRSRAALERGIYYVLSKQNQWESSAIAELRFSICRDPKLKGIILGAEVLNDPDGNKAEEYAWEKQIFGLSSNADFMKKLGEDLSQRPDPCMI